MALIKDGKILRTYEEQVAHLTEEHIKQLDINEDFEERITALEEGGGGGGEPPANMMTTDTEQNVTGAKYFGNKDAGSFVKLPGDNPETDDAEIVIQYGPQSVVIGRNEIKKDGNYTYYYPNSSGTLATTDNVKKYYRHRIFMYSSDVAGPPAIAINGYLISSRATPYTKQELTGMTPDNFVAFVNKLYGIQGKLVVNTGSSIYVYTELSASGHFVNMFYIDQQVNLTTGWLVQGNVSLELDDSWSLEHYTPEEI